MPRGITDVDENRVVIHVWKQRIHYGAVIKETRLPIEERKSVRLKAWGKPPVRELRYKVVADT